jgi:predicted N-acetyltransferase YhbS
MVHIRREQIQDIPAIYRVNALTFESQVEAEMVNQLRRRGAVPLSLAAKLEGEVVKLAEGAAQGFADGVVY